VLQLDGEKFAAVRSALVDLNKKCVAASPVGPYFLGETFSLADVAVVPFLARFKVLLAFYRDYDFLPAVRACLS
jgi:glutathione S-transferase